MQKNEKETVPINCLFSLRLQRGAPAKEHESIKALKKILD